MRHGGVGIKTGLTAKLALEQQSLQGSARARRQEITTGQHPAGEPRLLPRGRRSGDVSAQVALGRWGRRGRRLAHLAFILGGLHLAGEVAPRG